MANQNQQPDQLKQPVQTPQGMDFLTFLWVISIFGALVGIGFMGWALFAAETGIQQAFGAILGVGCSLVPYLLASAAQHIADNRK